MTLALGGPAISHVPAYYGFGQGQDGKAAPAEPRSPEANHGATATDQPSALAENKTDGPGRIGQSHQSDQDPSQHTPDQAYSEPDEDSSGFGRMSKEEEAEVREMAKRDREVRAHEQAHVAAAAGHASAPKYDYERGPDGRRYAVSGSVSIDTSKEETPEDTLRKAQTIKRAAMAPTSPSAQDRQVAAKAARMESEARAELTEERMAARTGQVTDGTPNDPGTGGPQGRLEMGSGTSSSRADSLIRQAAAIYQQVGQAQLSSPPSLDLVI